jgi:hypothetical protein
MTDDVEDNVIIDRRRSYFTIIPNLVDDLHLTPYAFRLYVHLARVVGNGAKCHQGTRYMSELCCMSAGKISSSKAELDKAGLIAITRMKSTRGGKPYDEIILLDLWERNAEYFKSKKLDSKRKQVHHMNLPSSPGEQTSSPHETKNNPLGIEAREEKPSENAVAFLSRCKERNETTLPGGIVTMFYDAVTKYLAFSARSAPEVTQDDITNYTTVVREYLGQLEKFTEELYPVFDYNYRNGKERHFWHCLQYYTTEDKRKSLHELPHVMREALKNWEFPNDLERGGEGYTTENFSQFVQAKLQEVQP